jgi:hypothetical protein
MVSITRLAIVIHLRSRLRLGLGNVDGLNLEGLALYMEDIIHLDVKVMTAKEDIGKIRNIAQFGVDEVIRHPPLERDEGNLLSLEDLRRAINILPPPRGGLLPKASFKLNFEGVSVDDFVDLTASHDEFSTAHYH